MNWFILVFKEKCILWIAFKFQISEFVKRFNSKNKLKTCVYISHINQKYVLLIKYFLNEVCFGLKLFVSGLQHLSLRELLLEPNEAQYLLDDVAINCCQSLVTLKLVNCSREPYPILHAGVFINLKRLVISPQVLIHSFFNHLFCLTIYQIT